MITYDKVKRYENSRETKNRDTKACGVNTKYRLTKKHKVLC